jgi:hypothetical protein
MLKNLTCVDEPFVAFVTECFLKKLIVINLNQGCDPYSYCDVKLVCGKPFINCREKFVRDLPFVTEAVILRFTMIKNSIVINS